MTKNIFNHSSLPQLIEFLSLSTKKLISLMNQKGVGLLVRNTRRDIDTLKDIINQRKITFGRF